MPRTELLRQDGMVGASIAGKDRAWGVSFPIADKRGGTIRITDDAGKPLVRGSLAEAVESDE